MRKGQKHTDESRAKMHLSQKGMLGRKHTEETKAKMRAAQAGHKVSDETKAKLSAIVSASMTPERRELQRQLSTGRSQSIEARVKIGNFHRGRKASEQKLQKMRGRKVSVETRSKISAKLKGHIVSEETRVKIAEKIRPIAPHSFRGGATADAFAAVLEPAGFIREYHVLWGRGNQRYQLDFAHISGLVNIELDGESHDLTQEEDAIRDAFLRHLGWRVIRIKLWPTSRR